MSRDHRKRQAFAAADDLVVRVYRATRGFPPDERFGLVSQLRRAAVSVPANIAEAAGRETGRDFLRVLQIAMGSLREVGYYVDLSRRLEYLSSEIAGDLEQHYNLAARLLSGLITSIQKAEATNKHRD